MSEETKTEDKPRIRREDDMLVVGDRSFSQDDLKKWSTWGVVEAHAKKLDAPVTSAEIAVIEDAAAHLGSGARNGLAEFKQALANAAKT